MGRPPKENENTDNTNPNEQNNEQKPENKYLVTYLSQPGVETVGKLKKKQYEFTIRPWEREDVTDMNGVKMVQVPKSNQKTIEDGDAIVVDERTYKTYIKSSQWSDKPKWNPETETWDHNPSITIEPYKGDLPSDGTGIIRQYKKQEPVDKKAIIEEIKQRTESEQFNVLRSTAKLVPGAG